MKNSKIDKIIDDCFNHYLCSGKLQINDLREEIRKKLNNAFNESFTFAYEQGQYDERMEQLLKIQKWINEN